MNIKLIQERIQVIILLVKRIRVTATLAIKKHQIKILLTRLITKSSWTELTLHRKWINTINLTKKSYQRIKAENRKTLEKVKEWLDDNQLVRIINNRMKMLNLLC